MKWGNIGKPGFALLILGLVVGCDLAPEMPKSAPSAIAFIPHRDAKSKCSVTRIVDGDTISLRCGENSGNARLVGFDTPETFQPGCSAEKRLGLQAKRELTQILSQANVLTPKFRGTDKYRRALLELSVDGHPLAAIMIRRGLAVRNNGERRINWCRRLAQG